MLKQVLLVLIIIMSMFINKEQLNGQRFFLFFGLAYYLNTIEFNFRYWIFTHIIFISLLLYSSFNMWTHNFIGVFNKGLDVSDTNKIIFISFYILTIANIYIYGLSNEFRNQNISKTGKFGKRGRRGLRGKSGKASSCEGGCKPDKLCYNKMLTNISDVYNEYCLKNNLEQLPKNKFIRNNFIKKKCRKMCESKAMGKLISLKGAKECYNYVFDSSGRHGKSVANPEGYPSIWRQWIELILKYENGKMFLDSEQLTDNDFDYLLTEKDILTFCSTNEYPNFCFIDENTKRKKVISPFDEIKKYDLWYWGSPKSSRPTYVEECSYIDEKGNKRSVDDGPILKIVDSNLYRSVWRSKTGRQSVVSVGSRNGSSCPRTLQYVPDKQTGTTKVSAYRSEDFHTKDEMKYRTYKPLGDVILEGDSVCHKRTPDSTLPYVENDTNNLNEPINTSTGANPLKAIKLVSGDIKQPVAYAKLYSSKSKDKNAYDYEKYNYSFWRPIPPTGYKCLGDVISNSVSSKQPAKDLVACVPDKCVRKSNGQGKKIWNSKNLNNDSVDPIKSSCRADLEYTSPGSKRDISDKSAEVYSDPEATVKNSCSNSNINIIRDTATNLFRVKLDNNNCVRNSYSYFNVDDDRYEIIPSGEPGSCLDKSDLDKSKFKNEWIVPEKYDKKYSIQKIYDE